MDQFALVPEDDIVPYDTQDNRSILCNGTQSLGNEYNEVLDWGPPLAVKGYYQNR